MNNMQFYGSWIDPNGNIVITSSEQSHIKVIRQLNLEDELLSASNDIVWSNDEILKCHNIDPCYIAFKLGYIRVTSFYNQFAIQLNKKPTITQIFAIEKFHKSLFNDNIEKYVIEYFNTFQYKYFDAFHELLAFLKNGRSTTNTNIK